MLDVHVLTESERDFMVQMIFGEPPTAYGITTDTYSPVVTFAEYASMVQRELSDDDPVYLSYIPEYTQDYHAAILLLGQLIETYESAHPEVSKGQTEGQEDHPLLVSFGHRVLRIVAEDAGGKVKFYQALQATPEQRVRAALSLAWDIGIIPPQLRNEWYARQEQEEKSRHSA